MAVAVACQRSLPASDLTASLSPDDGGPRLRPCSGSLVAGACRPRARHGRADRWQELIGVTVGGTPDVFVAGRYASERMRSTSCPRSRSTRAGRTSVRSIPRSSSATRRNGRSDHASHCSERPGDPAVVTAIHPDCDEWPANLLRFYVHFSAPMARQNGVGFVRVLDRQRRSKSRTRCSNRRSTSGVPTSNGSRCSSIPAA